MNAKLSLPGSSRLMALLVLMLSMMLSACSTVKMDQIKAKADQTLDTISTKTNIGKNPRDPLEGFNRVMFNFNDNVDQAVLQPVSRVYRDVTPGFVQTGVGNFSATSVMSGTQSTICCKAK